jgi:CRP-like cAMP-binding protein
MTADGARTDELEGIPLFAGLSPEDRARVASLARRLQWNVGHLVVKEGEFAFDFYAIKAGSAEVKQREELLRVLGPGDFFGELGVVPETGSRAARRRTASVVITAPTEAIAIAGGDLRRLAEEIPSLRAALLSAAAERGGNVGSNG